MRILNVLNEMTSGGDAQALIATHAPSMLRRIAPEHIRYLRLTPERTSCVTYIHLPDVTDDAHKFVREAVQAFPEIYFSRLVVLGEGDSEEIVLPRILQAKGAQVDESAVSIAPLGGRHVNHFWRLLSGLQIPYLTLLDLDVARYAAGWGRIKVINDQLAKFEPEKVLPQNWLLPKWNAQEELVRTHCYFEDENVTKNVFDELENRGIYFSGPLDLDFAMLRAFPKAYEVEEEAPDDATIKAVLGKKHHNSSQYSKEEQSLFGTYHERFKLGSKPAAHLDALARLSNEELLAKIPASLGRLADAVIAKLAELPE
jgi:putative ATP-dependent endonuclease of OLD family